MVLWVAVLGTGATAMQPEPSRGPAVGLPVAVHARDTTSGATSGLLFKPAGADPAAASGLAAPLTQASPGPGTPLFTAAALHWASQQQWRPHGLVGAPPPQIGHHLAYDPVGERVILLEGGVPGRMWARDGCQWSALTPSSLPLPRQFGALTTGTMNVLLFGGAGPGQLLSDTWEWNGVQWTQHVSPFEPPRRHRHAMAFDEARQRFVLFGGFDNGYTTLGDTWEFDGGGWGLIPPGTAPSARGDHAMAYDSDRGCVVLFGGHDGGSALADTWEFDGATWSQATPAANPPAMAGHAMAYDSVAQRVILTGADPLAPAAPCQTWEYDGSTWIQRPSTTALTSRVRHRMAFHQKDREMVLFGGIALAAPITLGDTWTLDAPRDLAINSMSLGLDFLPATETLPIDGNTAVPAESYIGLTFSVRDGAQGSVRAGTSETARFGRETNGNGSDLFTYIFDGSAPECLPTGSAPGDLNRSLDAEEGLVATAGAQELNGVDLFPWAYHTDLNITVPALTATPRMYFTVAPDHLGQVPASWWNGIAHRSAASILVTQWDPVAQTWSCPALWLSFADLHVGAPGAQVPLTVDEEIDALSLGRNDVSGGPPEFMAFSTRITRAGGAPTAAPDQMMIARVDAAAGPTPLPSVPMLVDFPTARLQGARPGRRASVLSGRLGIRPGGGGFPGDDPDGWCFWDPCDRVGGRGIFNSLSSQAAPPIMLPWPSTAGAAATYRHELGGETLTTVATGDVGDVAVLVIGTDPFLAPLVVVGGLAMPAGTAQLRLPVTPALAGISLTFHWLTTDPGFTSITRASMAMHF
ncbi:MAG: kelch repeat-containing protein [Planctomycetota bacterium]